MSVEQRLHERQAALAAQLAGLEADLLRIVEASASANLDDEHDPEGSTVAFERAQLAAVADSVRDELAAVEVALVRIASGTYGICVNCGRPIGAERLLARPATQLCIDCAR